MKKVAPPLDKARLLPDWMIGAGKRADIIEKAKQAAKPKPAKTTPKKTLPKKGMFYSL